MKRIFTLFALVIIVCSCGSSRVTVKKRKHKNVNNEHVVKRKSSNSEAEEESYNKEIINGKEVKIASTEDYILAFKSIAQEEMRLYGIPASITIAQGILESNSGRGRLSAEANNHFGIKCHDWSGDKIYHDDDASQECFRKYNDAKYSYRDHSLFLTQRQRYAELFKLRIEDYKGWAKELKRAGYATDSKYPDKLIGLIERYGLHKFDEEVLGSKYVKINEQVPLSEGFYLVEKGDTMYSISKKFNLTVKELQDINKLTDISLNVGQRLSVVKSSLQDGVSNSNLSIKTASTTKTHIVEKGDTLYSISKKYNVSISELQKLNGMSDTAISIGQELQIKNQ